jgi:hypothetical protein
MPKSKFGTLKEVDIRELWKHEQYDFSAWLAEKILEVSTKLRCTNYEFSYC